MQDVKMIVLSFLFTVLMIIDCKAEYDEFAITDNGKADAIIVIPENANVEIRYSAGTLNRYIEAISGTKLSIVTDRKIGDWKGNIIAIGDVVLAGCKDRLDTDIKDKLVEGEFCWKLRGNVLYLEGKSLGSFEKRFGNWEHGIWNGICRFAEEYLGICWLWPGDLGFVVPKNKKISVEFSEGDFRERPGIKRRRIRDRIYQKYWCESWSELGIDSKKYRVLAESTYAWQKFHLSGFSVNIIPGAHGFVDWWDKYHVKHPDWFAMQLDGTRDYPVDTNFGSPSTAKLCVSNPELIEAVANSVINYYRDNSSGTREIYRAGINDNTDVGICCCEHCKSWDVPDKAGAWTYRYRTGVWKYHYVTDRYVRFWNQIASRFTKVYPDKYISVNAYGCLEEPPWKETIKFRNILLTFTGFDYLNSKMLERDRIWWNRWSEKTKGKMNLRCNVFVEGYGFPLVYVHAMDKDFKTCFKDKLFAVEYEALYNYWATNGLNYYMLMKLLWNPGIDIDAELDRYCKKGFGCAADEIKKYFLEIEKLTGEISKHNWHWRAEFLRGIAKIYTHERIARLEKYLETGKKLARGDALKRIEFLEEGLRYARVQGDVLRAKINKVSSDELEEARRKRDEFFRNMKYPLSVSYPAVKYWQHCNRNLLE